MNSTNGRLIEFSSIFSPPTDKIYRHTAIMHPLRPRMSRSKALTIMSCIWLASAALSSPNIYFSEVKYENYASGEYRTICYIHWPDGPSTESTIDYLWVYFDTIPIKNQLEPQLVKMLIKITSKAKLAQLTIDSYFLNC